jgi:hypothetical protein
VVCYPGWRSPSDLTLGYYRVAPPGAKPEPEAKTNEVKAEPNGAARSQPVTPQTNRTSSAAGFAG